MSDRRPRDGPAGSWTADVTSSAPSGRRPMSHMAPYMGSCRSARLGPFVGVLDGVAEARTGRQRGRWPLRGVPACPSGASPHRSCGSSSLIVLPGDGVEGGGDSSTDTGNMSPVLCWMVNPCNIVHGRGFLTHRLVTQQRLPNGGHDVVDR